MLSYDQLVELAGIFKENVEYKGDGIFNIITIDVDKNSDANYVMLLSISEETCSCVLDYAGDWEIDGVSPNEINAASGWTMKMTEHSGKMFRRSDHPNEFALLDDLVAMEMM